MAVVNGHFVSPLSEDEVITVALLLTLLFRWMAQPITTDGYSLCA